MFRATIVCSILLIATVTADAALKAPNDVAVQVIVVDDISKLKDQGVQLTPISGIQERGQIRYTLGNRVSNDRLVSQNSDNNSWGLPQNVQLRLQYPTSGQGAVITYVNIHVNQSSNSGQAYVVSGGIGQRSIVIMVEAYNTYYFNYVAQIYGI